jgi:hypothetical protein
MRTIEVRVTVKNNGRLIIDLPTDMVAGEYNAVLVVEDRYIHTSLENAQAIFRRYIPANRKLSEELIQERREEASYE